MFSDRRRLLLGAALILVLGALAWTSCGPSEPAPVAVAERRLPAARGGRAASPDDPLPAADGVRLASLAVERARPANSSRNPFVFGRRNAAPSLQSADAPVDTAAAAPGSAAPVAPSGAPPLAPIPLKFIGMVEKGDGTRLAVLSPGEGRGPLHGTEGDIIDGRYRILKIGTESVEIAYVDGRGRQTIRLTGQ